MTDFTLGPGPLTPEFEQVKSDIGIVENGNTATHAIPAGYYVIWKGDLYVAKTDISSGTVLSTSNLTAKTQGIGKDVAELTSKITPSGLKNGNIDAYFDQDICWIQAANSSGSQPGFSYYQLEIIPNGNGQILQRATEMSNSRIANRLYANGAWSPWEPVAFSRELSAVNGKVNIYTKYLLNSGTANHTIEIVSTGSENVYFIFGCGAGGQVLCSVFNRDADTLMNFGNVTLTRTYVSENTIHLKFSTSWLRTVITGSASFTARYVADDT